jgi:hypothetical protein
MQSTSELNTRIVVGSDHSHLRTCRRTVQAIIHFEPGLRYLLRAQSGQSNLSGLLKANWDDNPCLWGAGITQPNAIALIEALFPDSVDNSEWAFFALASLMGRKEYSEDDYSGDENSEDCGNDAYSWHMDYPGTCCDFVFCNAPPLISAADAIWWIDFILFFVLKSRACNSTARLQRFNSNLSGLHNFMFGKEPEATINVLCQHFDIQTGRPVHTLRRR